jgi:hypothetical protein
VKGTVGKVGLAERAQEAVLVVAGVAHANHLSLQLAVAHTTPKGSAIARDGGRGAVASRSSGSSGRGGVALATAEVALGVNDVLVCDGRPASLAREAVEVVLGPGVVLGPAARDGLRAHGAYRRVGSDEILCAIEPVAFVAAAAHHVIVSR